MKPSENARESGPSEPGRPTEEIDERYSDVDPEEVAENAIDYFSDDPETESEKADGTSSASAVRRGPDRSGTGA